MHRRPHESCMVDLAKLLISVAVVPEHKLSRLSDSSIFHSRTTMNFMKKAAILAIAALGANAWDAAEKEAALKVVDECARGVQWWIFQSVADRIADESVAAPPARREPARPSAHPARRRAQREYER